jgi:hypothetical protein
MSNKEGSEGDLSEATNEKLVSLRPLDTKEALRALLNTKPIDKDDEKDRSQQTLCRCARHAR